MAKTPSFSKMTNKELVTAYNAMVGGPAGKALGHPRNRPILKFASSAAGIKRCETLASSIKAKGQAKRAKSHVEEPSDKRKEPRTNSRRQKAIDCLLKSVGKQVPRSDLLKAVYGSTDVKNRGALSMVLRGVVAVDITQRELPYRLVKEKNGKDLTFGLHKS